MQFIEILKLKEKELEELLEERKDLNSKIRGVNREIDVYKKDIERYDGNNIFKDEEDEKS